MEMSPDEISPNDAGTPGSTIFSPKVDWCLVSFLHFWNAWGMPNKQSSTKKIQQCFLLHKLVV